MQVTFYSTYFMEDDIVDGEYPRDDVRTDTYTMHDVEEVAQFFKSEGLSFKATGTDWAAEPDGSRIVNYATGRRVEVTGTIDGATDDEFARIVDLVG